MPITLNLTFPAGRFHATPWGRHVNEGVPEWPPSPWRLLRALVATWLRKCPDLSEPAVRRVLEQLVAPPQFHLPPARVAHTRHYMPWEKKGPADRALVFDTFVTVNRKDPVIAHWPSANLAVADHQTLARLLENLTTLGRAEGWVHAELASNVTAEWNCKPAADTDQELVSVFCPDPATAFGDEHYPPPPDGKKLKKGLKPDEHLFDCPRWHLCLDTQTLHAARWPRVPGALWVNYERPSDAFTRTAAPGGQASPSRRLPTIARYRLDAPVLPLVESTLPLAEEFRHRLLCEFKYVTGGLFSETLAGKNDACEPLRNHGHAFYLPADEDGDGQIDHVTVFAERGFGADEVRALDRLRSVRFGAGEPLRLMLVGLGGAEDFRARLLGPARVWVSATPFLATRYPKVSGTKRDRPEDYVTAQAFAMHVLGQELGRLGARRGDLPAVVGIEALDVLGGRNLRCIQFRRFRKKAGDDGGRRPCGAFRITFAAAVRGPICLGHSCHFGMGLFLPDTEAGRSGSES